LNKIRGLDKLEVIALHNLPFAFLHYSWTAHGALIGGLKKF